MANVHEEVRSALNAKKVKDLPRPKSIVEFSTDTELHQAFSTLMERRILSAPVFDHATREYVGFLDCRDLVEFVASADKSARHNTLKDLVSAAPEKTVTIASLAQKHRFERVDENATLYDVAKILQTRSRRVPFFENGVLVNIISQSTLIQYLCQHLKDMPVLKATTVAAAGIGSSPVIKAKLEVPAREVFGILGKTGRFGMAVLGQDDAIVTQTSAQDLKLWLKMPSHELLDLPIMKFLQVIRSQDIEIQVPALSCSEKDPLSFVIQKLEATRQHRIYVVDQFFHPIKVVSLTDLLQWCVAQ